MPSRPAASSMATVVRCRSLDPNRRIMRLRRSSRCSSRNTTTTRTMPTSVSGETTGPSTFSAAPAARVRAPARARAAAWACRQLAQSRRGGAGGVGFLNHVPDLVIELLKETIGLAEPALLQSSELRLHGGLVLRQVAGEPGHLRTDDRTDAAEQP